MYFGLIHNIFWKNAGKTKYFKAWNDAYTISLAGLGPPDRDHTWTKAEKNRLTERNSLSIPNKKIVLVLMLV